MKIIIYTIVAFIRRLVYGEKTRTPPPEVFALRKATRRNQAAIRVARRRTGNLSEDMVTGAGGRPQ